MNKKNTYESYDISVKQLLNEISELKSQNEELENYRMFYNQAPLPYHSLDENGNIIDVNPMWLNVLGYKRKEVIGRYIRNFLHPDWGIHYDENFPKFKKHGMMKDVHFKIKHKNGHYIDILLDGCIGYNLDGSFKQTYCAFKDVTDTIKTEDRYRKLSEAAIEGIVISDKGIVLEANQQIGEILKIDHKKLIGMKAFDFVAPESREIVEKNIKTGSEEPYEHYAKKSDGTIFPVEARARSLPMEGKTLRVTIIRDITNQKQVEEELFKHKENLEKLVMERTKELEEKNKMMDNNLKMFAGREMTILNLQKQIKELEKQLDTR